MKAPAVRRGPVFAARAEACNPGEPHGEDLDAGLAADEDERDEIVVPYQNGVQVIEMPG